MKSDNPEVGAAADVGSKWDPLAREHEAMVLFAFASFLPNVHITLHSVLSIQISVHSFF